MKKKQHFSDLQWSGVKKLLLVMKLTAFLLFFSVMAIAAGTYGQETRFDLNVKDANVIQVFDEIERITEFGFLFKTDQLDLNQHFTLDIKRASIEQILNEVLDKDQYKYTVIDRNIIIIKSGANTLQDGKSKSITGKVTDASGAPIPGATVVVKGTTTGVTTDNDGNFTLLLPPAAKALIFSFVGMKTQEVEIGNKSDYRITLTEETIGLEEVVAIGYGTVKKSSLTGALSAIGGKELKDRPVNSISNALNGLAPGLSVITSTGVPGQSSAIRIRGVGTFNNTAPLYVIDGVIRDQTAMDALDMNAISDISILKDAASAAVYGSRAGNGVILINTKQGRIQAPEITFKSSYGMESSTVDTKMMTAYENGLFINDMTYNMKPS